ncbi:MAG: hypothetical protein M0Z44_07445 [Gammaproteobacteria bacterium]|nr:hypothetical protein [Gammaproteobacteria bacterium]
MRLLNNPWLKHGPQGFLAQRLARHALAGWVLFAASGALLALESVAVALKSPVVVAVRPDGRLLGRIVWSGHAVRSTQTMVRASVRFVRDYLSANSDTVVHDYGAALAMMSGPLLARTVKTLRATRYLARVRQDRTRSWVVFGQGAKRPRLVGWSGHTARVRVEGVLHVVRIGGQQIRDPFAVLLSLVPAHRSLRDGSGARVTAVRFIGA